MPPHPSRRQGANPIIALLAVALVAVSMSALDLRLTPRHYTVGSNKVTAPVRLLLLTDLHSQEFGAGQQQLLDAVATASPDVVLLGGDIYDDITPRAGATEFVHAVAARYPTFYVTGNHEYWSGDVPGIVSDVKSAGATVLSGECVPFSARSQTIRVCGVDDPEVGESVFAEQLKAVSAPSEDFTVLLAHRPERIDQYRAENPDVVLAGHTHGGQFRIPYLLDGLFAPDQGFFPALGGGEHIVDGTPLIISRGLVRSFRIWNPPELVLVEVTPA